MPLLVLVGTILSLLIVVSVLEFLEQGPGKGPLCPHWKRKFRCRRCNPPGAV